MRFRFRSKVVPLLVLYGLLIGLILPVSALDTVDNGPYDIFEKLTINVPDEQKYVPGEILVKFNPGVSEEKIKNINAGHGTQVTYTSPYAGFKILKIPKTKTVEEMTEIYSKNPNVEYAVPNALMCAFMTPTDPYYKYQWNFKNGAGGINLEPAWDISSGEGVIVAVLDTGVAYENYGPYIVAPDLANTYFVQGKDFVNSDDHANDDNGHGTHVTGTIAQRTNNGIGVAGVAYNCKIMPVKVLNNEGSGNLDDLTDGIYFATDNGADVISMSLGFPPEVYPGVVLDNALEYAYQKGVIVVAAAGNDGTGTVSYPAAYENCIAVGATRYDGNRAYYSNYGYALGVMAPGGDMTVDQNGDGHKDGILQNTFNPTTKDPADFSYWFFQGTSMATPHVSGVAALLISEGANGPDEVRAAIQDTATDLGTSGWDNYYGYGLVNATAALEYITSTPNENMPPVAEANGPYSVVENSVYFSSEGSYDPDGIVVSYEWDFGDGTEKSSDQNPSHTYSTEGNYDVTLTVTDNGGATDNDEATVTIGTISVSNVEVTPISRRVGKNTFVSAKAVVTILNSSNSPVEGAIVSGKWSGATFDISATTNNEGTVTVYSDEVKYKRGTLTFTFTVNDVSHEIPWDRISVSGTGTYPET
ncbi:MAG: PKD domain-containing protein [Methanosarcina sp.]|nr:MAG: PKD domain-containing protein [Methanosarcina sp.]